jgi:hypothetical protein
VRLAFAGAVLSMRRRNADAELERLQKYEISHRAEAKQP